MIVVIPGNPDRVIDAATTGTLVRYDSYSRNGTGINQLVGYGRVKGVAAGGSGTGTPTSTTTTGSSSSSNPVTNAAAMIGGYIGAGLDFILIGLAVLIGGIVLWKAMGS